jgi:ACR3 family arsenite efflux pump ArsB
VSRTAAVVAITILIVLFVVGVVDFVNAPYSGSIPKSVLKLVEAILIGVAIVLIAGGLIKNNNNHRNGNQ